ncbi:MAG TPA: TonB family protein [Rhodocyclaceae bacterium]|nr:TonB family protein [Rhodocyclaceae bacterium]
MLMLSGCASVQPTMSCHASRTSDSQNPAPQYPASSRQANEEGTVVLRVFVSALGYPEQVQLKQSSGYPALDQAAAETVGRWCFLPAKNGDQAVAAWVNIPIVFRLTPERRVASQESGLASTSWADQVREKVRSNIVFAGNIPQDVVAKFSVRQLPNGEIVKVSLIASSGHPLFDQAVERALMKSSPLPQAPSSETFFRDIEFSFKP